MSDILPHGVHPNPVIRHLAARFGSQSRLAQAAGVKPHTINGRKPDGNALTHMQMRRVLIEGPRMGVTVTPADFFPDLFPEAAEG